MILSEVVERFVEESPVTVLARAAPENAVPPSALDALFASAAERQDTRDLLFSDGRASKARGSRRRES